jgi:hypothetical protein
MLREQNDESARTPAKHLISAIALSTTEKRSEMPSASEPLKRHFASRPEHLPS